MQNPRIAARYAKSILDLAVELNSVDAVYDDMQLMNKICTTSPEFVTMLRSPVINADKKNAVVAAVLSGKVNQITSGFLTLLINKGREQNLPEIARAFIAQFNEMKHIKTVKLTTAAVINDSMKEKLVSKINSFMGDNTIELEVAVNEELIGGFVLEVDDKLFDASVRKGLDGIRSQIIDTSYISKLR